MLDAEKKVMVSKYGKKFLVKAFFSICMFACCFMLKSHTQTEDIPVWNTVESVLVSEIDYRAEFKEIGEAIKNKENVGAVFRDFLLKLFLINKRQRESFEETLPIVRAADLSVERLSFEMSSEELSDDTSSEPFVLPGATADTTLNFSHTTPLYGVITSPFGYRDHPILQSRSFHTGIDIAAPEGDIIGSFADGTVLQVGYNNVYGNFLLIGHGDTYRSFYGHTSKVLVKEGQQVSIGQSVAEVGTTGLSTGPHLHFEVRRGEKRLDPVKFVRPNL